MSMTVEFFQEICRRGGDDDRPFVDAREIAEMLGMNDTDLVAALQALEEGGLVEEFDRAGGVGVRLTERGRERCAAQVP